MKRTVAKVTCGGTHRVIHDDSKESRPYTIYYEYIGYNCKRRKLKIGDFETLSLCMDKLAQLV